MVYQQQREGDHQFLSTDNLTEDEGHGTSNHGDVDSDFQESEFERSPSGRVQQFNPAQWANHEELNAHPGSQPQVLMPLSVVQQLIEIARASQDKKLDIELRTQRPTSDISATTLISSNADRGQGDLNDTKPGSSSSHRHQNLENDTDGLVTRMPSEPDRSTILENLLIASAPRLRHLASSSSIDTTSSFHTARPSHKRYASTVTPAVDQRHPGKPGVRLSRHHRPFEPNIEEETGHDEWGLATEDPAGGRISTTPSEPHEEGLLTGAPLILLIIGLSLVVFLISIDRTIITTAIPFITAEFKSTKDIGWYGSAYLLTACAFQPIYGRVFTSFNVKWSYLLSMFIFEGGSLISGFSPNSNALIVGRAIAGFGSAGILTGSFVIVATAVPINVRPIYTAVVGLMFGVGATIGPLIGGVFTDLLTWRWCFWINLPVGAVTIIVMFLVFHPKPHAGPKRGILDRLIDLDLIGNFILLVSAVLLFLGLEFTLTSASGAGSPTVIGMFVATAIAAGLLVTWLWWKQEGALIPPSIIRRRTVSAACLMAFFTYGALLIHSYFLPIWFQAVLGYSAIQSGVAMIPYFVFNALFSVLSGIFVSAVGYFAPPAIIGSAIGTVGSGVITLFAPGIATGTWVGYEILASAGFGLSIQQGFTAVSTVLEKDDLAVGTATVVASQSLGGALFISIGNAVFQNKLKQLVNSGNPALDGIDVASLLADGAVAFRKLVDPAQLPAVIDLYDRALHEVFITAIPLAGLAFLACCLFEWRSVKPPSVSKEESEGRL